MGVPSNNFHRDVGREAMRAVVEVNVMLAMIDMVVMMRMKLAFLRTRLTI